MKTMPPKIRIEAVPVKDLCEFVRTYGESGSAQEISPITAARALSLSKNPNAQSDDVGLLAAYAGEKCVGHLGVISGSLLAADEKIPMLWTFGLYVLPDYRAGTAVFQLMKALIALKRDIVVTGFNEPSRQLCTAFGFLDFGRLTSLKIDLRNVDLPGAGLRLFSRWANRDRGKQPQSNFVQSAFYRPLRRMFLSAIHRKAQKRLAAVRWREVPQLREPVDVDPQHAIRFDRELPTVNWMLEYPWITEGGPETSPPYAFSNVRNLSRFFAVELRNEQDECVGSLTLSITEKRGMTLLRILDVRLSETDQQQMLLWVAFHYAKRFDVEQIVLPIETEPWVRRIFPLSRLLVRLHRSYQWLPNSQDGGMSKAIEKFGPPKLNYTDGDCAFG